MHTPAWLSDDESQCMHASSYLPTLPKPVSPTHTVTHSLSGSWLAHHFSWIFGWTCPGTKLFPVSQIPPSLVLVRACVLIKPQSVPPALSLLPCVPSSGAPYVQVLVVQCGMWWGGGRQAGLKGGAQLFPHTQHPPPTALSLTWPFGGGGGQSKGCREMELRTLVRHTHTLLLNSRYTWSILNECKRET